MALPESEETRHIRMVGQSVTLSYTLSKIAACPSEFGEQTEKVLSEVGADEIVALNQVRVV